VERADREQRLAEESQEELRRLVLPKQPMARLSQKNTKRTPKEPQKYWGRLGQAGTSGGWMEHRALVGSMELMPA